MHRTKTTLLTLCLLLTACASKGPVATQPTTPTDPIREIAFQSDRAKDALQAVTDTKQALFKEGLITRPQSQALTDGLLKATRLLNQINAATKKYKTVSDGKAELTSLLDQLQPAFNTLTQIAPGLSPKAVAQINGVLSIAGGAIAALTPLIKGIL